MENEKKVEVTSTKLSDLINVLKSINKTHGDMPVIGGISKDISIDLTKMKPEELQHYLRFFRLEGIFKINSKGEHKNIACLMLQPYKDKEDE